MTSLEDMLANLEVLDWDRIAAETTAVTGQPCTAAQAREICTDQIRLAWAEKLEGL